MPAASAACGAGLAGDDCHFVGSLVAAVVGPGHADALSHLAAGETEMKEGIFRDRRPPLATPEVGFAAQVRPYGIEVGGGDGDSVDVDNVDDHGVIMVMVAMEVNDDNLITETRYAYLHLCVFGLRLPATS